MRRFAACLAILWLSATLVLADIPANYYDSANTSSASALRSSLNNIVRNGHSAVGYANTWNAIKAIDEDPLNSSNVILIYTGQSRSKAAQCSTNCNDGDAFAGTWSREHLWPQSSFDSREPMRSDLHALFPCDQDVNSARSNKPFNYVLFPTYTAGGSKGDSNFWEVRPQDRGNVARAMFYMDIRYEGGNGLINLVLNDNPNLSNNAGQSGILSTLLQWHFEDPPDAREIQRNHGVYDRQGNANPFIDHPEWVTIVYNLAPASDGDTLQVASVNRAPLTGFPGGEIPMLSLDLTANSNEWDVQSIAVSNVGTVPDGQIASVNIYYDADDSGSLSASDVLIDSRAFSAGSTALNMNSFRVTTTGRSFLLTLVPQIGAQTGNTLQLRVDANGIAHSPTGGNDIDPTFAAITSSATQLVPAVTGEVLITEIMYDPQSTEPGGEWVEIFNSDQSPASLMGWRLQDEDGQTGTFDLTLQPGEAAILIPSTTSISDFQGAWGTGFQIRQLTGWSTGGLGNLANSATEENEILTLRNAMGDVVDEVNYVNGGSWPTSNNSASIYLRPQHLTQEANDIGANWARSVSGTHGARNSTAFGVFTDSDIGSPGYVSAAPAIGAIDAHIEEDTPGDVEITFTDLNDSPAGTFTATLSNVSMGLFGAPSIAKTGARTYRITALYTPPQDAHGTVTFDLAVSDGESTTNASGLSFEVLSVNDLPTISAIADQETDEGIAVGPIAFTVGDVESAPENLFVSGESDNIGLLPNENIAFGGAGANRTVTLTPAPGQSGTANVTIFVEDEDDGIAGTTFLLTVNPATTTVGEWWIIE